MRICSRLLFAAFILTVSTIAAHADSFLVGTDLSGANGGSGLCPSDANCEVLAQEFTLFAPIRIDQIKVAVGPYMDPFAGGDFNVSLSDRLGGGTYIGTDYLSTDSAQVFDFGNLNMDLDAGTYYLTVSGGNVTWAFASDMPGLAGALGSTWMCDPTLTCGSGRWQSVSGSHAMEIDGNVITPEPASWLLFGTGALGLAGVVRRKFLHL